MPLRNLKKALQDQVNNALGECLMLFAEGGEV